MTYINRYGLVQKKDGIIVAVSGGADSVCLLLLFLELQQELELKLHVVHVEHGIRGEESKEDAEFVKELCCNKGVSCEVRHVKVLEEATRQKKGTEEMARILRYQILEEIRSQKEQEWETSVKIALAHHGNDNVETMIFQSIRGGRIASLRGMEPARDAVIRPLLFATRKEIEGYLQKKQQDFCVDSTNQTTIYQRNFIRHQMIPDMERINTQAVAHLGQIAEYMRELEAFLKGKWEPVLELAMKDNQLEKEAVLALDTFLQKELLRGWIEKTIGGKDISSTHLQGVFQILHGGVGKEIDLPRAKVTSTYTHLVISSKEDINCGKEACVDVRNSDDTRKQLLLQELEIGQAQKITWKNKIVEIELQERKKGIIPAKTYTKWFDCDKIKSEISFRTRQPGDYLIVTMAGGKKKLKDYFIDEKVPKEHRDQILLLCEGSKVIWVVGYRMSEDVKVSDNTKKVLKAQVMEEKENE